LSHELPDPVEAVLLDAGGVLIDLDYRYLQRLIEPVHREVPEAELSQAESLARKEINRSVGDDGEVAHRWREYFHIILGHVGVCGDRHAAIIDSLWEAHQRVGLWTVAAEGALAAVGELRRRGYRLGVVSNAEGTVARNLDDAGFAGLFDTVVDSHLVGVMKPDPAIFRIALERMSLEAGKVVFVGDMPEIDVKGARAAGIAPILIDRHDMHTDVATPRIRSLGQLPDLLEGTDLFFASEK
jgi:putative hydrolase of the HAD superfamily